MQATEPLVKEILGPILEQYQPAGIASLKMDRFHIGKVPPLIDGKIKDLYIQVCCQLDQSQK